MIDVVSYEHAPIATGETLADGASRFLDTTVRPEIKALQGADFQAADALHKKLTLLFYFQISQFPSIPLSKIYIYMISFTCPSDRVAINLES